MALLINLLLVLVFITHVEITRSISCSELATLYSCACPSTINNTSALDDSDSLVYIVNCRNIFNQRVISRNRGWNVTATGSPYIPSGDSDFDAILELEYQSALTDLDSGDSFMDYFQTIGTGYIDRAFRSDISDVDFRFAHDFNQVGKFMSQSVRNRRCKKISNFPVCTPGTDTITPECFLNYLIQAVGYSAAHGFYFYERDEFSDFARNEILLYLRICRELGFNNRNQFVDFSYIYLYNFIECNEFVEAPTFEIPHDHVYELDLRYRDMNFILENSTREEAPVSDDIFRMFADRAERSDQLALHDEKEGEETFFYKSDINEKGEVHIIRKKGRECTLLELAGGSCDDRRGENTDVTSVAVEPKEPYKYPGFMTILRIFYAPKQIVNIGIRDCFIFEMILFILIVMFGNENQMLVIWMIGYIAYYGKKMNFLVGAQMVVVLVDLNCIKILTTKLRLQFRHLLISRVLMVVSMMLLNYILAINGLGGFTILTPWTILAFYYLTVDYRQRIVSNLLMFLGTFRTVLCFTSIAYNLTPATINKMSSSTMQVIYAALKLSFTLKPSRELHVTMITACANFGAMKPKELDAFIISYNKHSMIVMAVIYGIVMLVLPCLVVGGMIRLNGKLKFRTIRNEFFGNFLGGAMVLYGFGLGKKVPMTSIIIIMRCVLLYINPVFSIGAMIVMTVISMSMQTSFEKTNEIFTAGNRDAIGLEVIDGVKQISVRFQKGTRSVGAGVLSGVNKILTVGHVMEAIMERLREKSKEVQVEISEVEDMISEIDLDVTSEAKDGEERKVRKAIRNNDKRRIKLQSKLKKLLDQKKEYDEGTMDVLVGDRQFKKLKIINQEVINRGMQDTLVEVTVDKTLSSNSCSFGEITETNWMYAPVFNHVNRINLELEGNVLKYRDNTKNGYSGSPIINQRGEVIGLHVGGNKSWNVNGGIVVPRGKIEEWLWRVHSILI